MNVSSAGQQQQQQQKAAAAPPQCPKNKARVLQGVFFAAEQLSAMQLTTLKQL
jgi:hypothetical protein